MLGLPVGAHISVKGTDADGKDVMRPYTPVSDDNLRGYVDFVIKVCASSAPVGVNRPTGLWLLFHGPRKVYGRKKGVALR